MKKGFIILALVTFCFNGFTQKTESEFSNGGIEFSLSGENVASVLAFTPTSMNKHERNGIWLTATKANEYTVVLIGMKRRFDNFDLGFALGYLNNSGWKKHSSDDALGIGIFLKIEHALIKRSTLLSSYDFNFKGLSHHYSIRWYDIIGLNRNTGLGAYVETNEGGPILSINLFDGFIKLSVGMGYDFFDSKFSSALGVSFRI